MIPDRALVDAIKAAIAKELRRQADAVPLLPGWCGPYVDLEEIDGMVTIDGHIDLEAVAAAAAQPAAAPWDYVFARREMLGAIPRVPTLASHVELPAPTGAGLERIVLERCQIGSIWRGTTALQAVWRLKVGAPSLIFALPGYRPPSALEMCAAQQLARSPWGPGPAG